MRCARRHLRPGQPFAVNRRVNEQKIEPALVQRSGGDEQRVDASQQPAVRTIAGVFFVLCYAMSQASYRLERAMGVGTR